MCLVRSPLIYHSLTYAIRATLSSYNTVGLFLIKNNSYDFLMCCIMDLDQTHSRLASFMASISEWLEEVATIVCFNDLQDIAVFPYVNIYPVCDQAF